MGGKFCQNRSLPHPPCYILSYILAELWQQLEFVSELESDLQDTVDWDRKWLVDFNTGKTQLVLFNRSKTTGAIVIKMDGSVLEEKSSFKILRLSFSSNLDCGSYIISIVKILDSFYKAFSS